MGKLYDIAAKTGTYTNSSGEEKSRWQNVGVVVETKSGGQVILLDRTFNPAGLPDDGSGKVMLSMFEPKDDKPKAQPQGKPKQAQGGQRAPDFDDSDIPFAPIGRGIAGYAI